VFINRPDGATSFGGTVIFSGTTNSTGFTALEGGTLQFSDFNQLGTGHFEFNAAPGVSGTLRYTGGSATTTKTIYMDNPDITGTIDVTEAGTTLTWNPGFSIINQDLAKDGAGTLVFGANGISGDANVSVSAGKLVLTGSNSYSGGSTVSGGVLEVSGGSSPGGNASGLGSGPVAIGPGGQVTYWLSYSNSHTITNAFSLSGGTLYSEDGLNTFSGQVTLTSGTSTIAAHYEDIYTFSGGLTGSGNVLFTQAGGTGAWAAPTFVLSAAGSNTGFVRVSGSSGGGATKLQLANVNALQTATLDLATGDEGSVEFTVSGTNTYALGGLRGSRNLAIGANSLSVGGNGGSSVYSGGITGTGGLLKSGTGRLELTGLNAFTGQTTLEAGELSLNGSLASLIVSTAAATTLSGTGTLLGNVTIEGIHSPGNSPGVQTIGGDLTYSGSSSSVVWELVSNTASPAGRGVSYDGIDVGGNLSFAGPTVLSLVFNGAGSTVNWNDSFWDTTVTGTNGWLLYDVAGTTTGLSNLTLSGTNWLDSLGNSFSDVRPDTTFALSQIGNDVYVTVVAVPEPSSVVLLCVGAVFFAGVRHRRRSSLLGASGTSPREA
jgi:autotransporter-associated beta strand protein